LTSSKTDQRAKIADVDPQKARKPIWTYSADCEYTTPRKFQPEAPRFSVRIENWAIAADDPSRLKEAPAHLPRPRQAD